MSTAPACYAKGYSPTNANCVQNCTWVNGCAISKGFVPPNPNQPQMVQNQVPPPPQFYPQAPVAGPSAVPVPPMSAIANQMQQQQQGAIPRANFIPMPMPRITKPGENESGLSRFGKNVLMSSLEMMVATGYLWLQQIDL
jgi:hypothetical protein